MAAGSSSEALMEVPPPEHCSSGAACKSPHDVADLELWQDLGQPEAWFCAKCWGGEEEPPGPPESGEHMEEPTQDQHMDNIKVKVEKTEEQKIKDIEWAQKTDKQKHIANGWVEQWWYVHHMDKDKEEKTEEQKIEDVEWAQKMTTERNDNLEKWHRNGLGRFASSGRG